MKDLRIKIEENHLLIEIKKEDYTKDLKSSIKSIEAVKVFNAICISDRMKISVFPFVKEDLRLLKRNVKSKFKRRENLSVSMS